MGRRTCGRGLGALLATLLFAVVGSVRISPDLPPAQRAWDATGNSDFMAELPFDYVANGPGNITLTTVKTAPGCAPEQVRLTWYGTDDVGRVSVLVSWSTCDAIAQSSSKAGECIAPAQAGDGTVPLSTTGLVSHVYWGVDRGSATRLTRLAKGNATAYVYNYVDYAGVSYASAVVHHVLITGLTRGARYAYAVVDSVQSASQDGSTNRPLRPGELGPNPFRASFKAPGRNAPDAQQFPLHVAVVGDPGQTYNTSRTLTHIMRAWGLEAGFRRPWNRGGLDLALVVGDATYADDPGSPGTVPDGCKLSKGSYQQRWDTWQRLFQPLLSAIPGMWVPGNHEIEILPGNTSFDTTDWTALQTSYNSRLPVPQRGARAQPATVPITGRASGYANGYWINKVPGVATFIGLTNYSPNDVDPNKPDKNGFSKMSQQYMWLESQLKDVDRAATPWLIVTWHAPWYHTYGAHFKENECMRQLYEPLLLQYSVDIVFNGHVHSYERTKPVANYTEDDDGCAPMHVVIGDAGNISGAEKAFISPDYVDKRLNCSNPTARTFPGYQPQQCLAFNSGLGSGCGIGVDSCYCYALQPAWSAYREPSFGHGRLYLQTPTKAVWQWIRNQDSHMEVADEVEITRLPRCGAVLGR